MYKLLAKLLAERLKTVLGDIIGESQGAFVEDGKILDEVLIANELIYIRKREQKPRFLLKIDMKKAYYFVDWIFAY